MKAELHNNPVYQERLKLSRSWGHRFQKWALVNKMFAGSIHFEGPGGAKRLKHLDLRVASYSGYFASHFKDRPTPKQYFVCGPSVDFIKRWGFSGYADEEPMESNHAVRNV